MPEGTQENDHTKQATSLELASLSSIHTSNLGGVDLEKFEITWPIDGIQVLKHRVQQMEFLMFDLKASVDKIGNRVEDLENDMNSTITCRVCYKHAPIDGVSHVNVLSCGHAFCSVCAFSMKSCATCRSPVIGKFRLFI